MPLLLLGWRLDVSLALVAFAADTSDRVHSLSLLVEKTIALVHMIRS